MINKEERKRIFYTKKVAIYTTPTCTYCKAAKELFKEHNVKYDEYDVAADIEKRKEMIDKSGQLGVPVITVDDDVMVGYDHDTLLEALGIKAS